MVRKVSTSTMRDGSFPFGKGTGKPTLVRGHLPLKFQWITHTKRFSVETLQLGSSSCTVVYQGVATRNIPTTREICLKDETFRSPRRPCEAVHQGHKNVTVL